MLAIITLAGERSGFEMVQIDYPLLLTHYSFIIKEEEGLTAVS